MALIIESIYVENCISLQVKVHEINVKSLKPRKSIMRVIEEYEEETEDDPEDEKNDIFSDEED